MAAIQPQVSLELACLQLIRSLPGERWGADNSDRTFNGEPPPRCGEIYCAVWWSGRRRGDRGKRTQSYEEFGVNVTVTLRGASQPWDRWLKLRDELERRLNVIKAMLHGDCSDSRVARLAAALSGKDGAGQPIGFRECLSFEDYDDLQECGPDWFKAELDHADRNCGLAQTAHFGGLKESRQFRRWNEEQDVRYRCTLCVIDTGRLRVAYEFEADMPLCPRCGAQGPNLIAPLVDVHLLVLDPRGAIDSPNGRQYLACMKTRDHLAIHAADHFAASGEPTAVTCPRCKGTAVYKDMARLHEEIALRERLARQFLIDTKGGCCG